MLATTHRNRYRLNHESLESRRMLATFTVTNASDSDTGSLRAAIDGANGTVVADLIVFDSALSGQTIELTGTELFIVGSVTIDASMLAEPVTVDANHLSRVMNNFSTVAELSLQNINLTGGLVDGEGGGLYSRSNRTVTLMDCSIHGNSSVLGGGIVTNGPVTITNSSVTGNTSSGHGGGVDSVGGPMTLIDSVVSGNSSGDHGGGLFSHEQGVILTNSTVRDNTSGGRGGGISGADSVILTASQVTGNSSAGDGGGISVLSGDVSIQGSSVMENTSGSRGGGVATFAGLVHVSDSRVAGNTSSLGGGGVGKGSSTTRVSATDMRVVIDRSTIVANSAGFWGGGIYADWVDISSTTVADNSSASRGGGLFGFVGSAINSTISGNSSGQNGGGVVGSLTLISCTVTANSSSEAGGGVSGANTIENSIVAGNVDGGTAPDVRFSHPENVMYSLIGDTTGSGLGTSTGAGNILDQQALLGPLADNGGPTLTHALLSGSPALDAGDPDAIAGLAGVPQFDQRGEEFTRTFGRVDMGSYERQSLCTLDGDLDCNGWVSASDLDLVLRNWGLDASTMGVPVGWIHDLPEGTIGADELDSVLVNWGNTVPVASHENLLSVDRSVQMHEEFKLPKGQTITLQPIRLLVRSAGPTDRQRAQVDHTVSKLDMDNLSLVHPWKILPTG